MSFHLTETASKHDTLKFKVYFKELKYTLMSQQPQMELSNLISNTGGILGLFLGISFLSFIELVELAIIIMYSVFDKSEISTINLIIL